MQLRAKSTLFLSLGVVIMVSAWLFFPLVQNPSGQLLDWNDYPLMVWIIDQHIDHASHGEWAKIFESNMFYPFQDSLLFSDLLLPSALITSLFALFTSDRILAFTGMFFVTWVLNTFAAWYLWKKFWQGPQLLAAVLLSVWMPFVVINISHFQLLVLWPFLLGLSQLFVTGRTWKQAGLLGVWASVTFVSSVYLALFLLCCIAVWIGVQFLAERKKILHKTYFWDWMRWFVVFGSTLLVLAGPFVYAYMNMQNHYGVTREFSEYVQYAAGLLDFTATSSYFSAAGTIPVLAKWNSKIAFTAGGFFPGFMLVGLAAASLGYFFKKQPWQVGVSIALNRNTVFFGTLLVMGFVFSLGPLLRIGQDYLGPPLPYSILLKLIPIFEPIRVTQRWLLLWSLGLVFFAVQGLGVLLQQTQKRNQWLLVVVVLALVGFEVLPVHRPIQAPTAAQAIDAHIHNLCKPGEVLLEFPMTYDPVGGRDGVFQKLQHWTGIVLDATAHDCAVVNGYSGYFPAQYTEYEQNITAAVQAGEIPSITGLLQDRGVSLLRVHWDKVTATESATIRSWTALHAHIEYESESETVYRMPTGRYN